jgi:hypothetical protein
MTTAIQAASQLKVPTRDVLEMLGETDPERKIKEWMNEQMEMAYFQGVLQHIQFEASQAIEQQMAQAQLQSQVQQAQGMIEQQMAQAQEQQGAAPGEPQGIPGVEGPGFNPAAGGIPPQTAAPGATREGQTGMARNTEQPIQQ